jgi:hypothetical protein
MFPLPKTLKQLRAFLGLTGYCRIWILGYAALARPLYQILKRAQKAPQPFIKWDDKSKKCIPLVKKGLLTAPALDLPVKDKFQLYVCENGRLALEVVTQLQGFTVQSVGYLSKDLDPMAKGWSGI